MVSGIAIFIGFSRYILSTIRRFRPVPSPPIDPFEIIRHLSAMDWLKIIHILCVMG
jgi:hypothetical protein